MGQGQSGVPQPWRPEEAKLEPPTRSWMPFILLANFYSSFKTSPLIAPFL